eukprot:Rhum_TRINITY_DN14798_c8_g1::Rhum_TRINITY_DN14798_c8_g1_i1::g.111012::m.111012
MMTSPSSVVAAAVTPASFSKGIVDDAAAAEVQAAAEEARAAQRECALGLIHQYISGEKLAVPDKPRRSSSSLSPQRKLQQQQQQQHRSPYDPQMNRFLAPSKARGRRSPYGKEAHTGTLSLRGSTAPTTPRGAAWRGGLLPGCASPAVPALEDAQLAVHEDELPFYSRPQSSRSSRSGGGGGRNGDAHDGSLVFSTASSATQYRRLLEQENLLLHKLAMLS